MLYLDAPKAVNGDALHEELRAAGVTTAGPTLVGDELRFVDLDDVDRAAVESVVAAHTGEPLPQPASAGDRIAALESRLDAVAALAEKANATATEVAAAAKPSR